jgi:chromosome segregation ATPase
MYSLGIEMRFDDNYDPLDTIEERSQECTPQVELARQISRDWNKLQTISFNNKSDLLSISEADDELFQNFCETDEKHEEFDESTRVLIKHIAKLSVEVDHLKKVLHDKNQEILETDSENSDLKEKMNELSTANKFWGKVICKNNCLIF